MHAVLFADSFKFDGDALWLFLAFLCGAVAMLHRLFIVTDGLAKSK